MSRTTAIRLLGTILERADELERVSKVSDIDIHPLIRSELEKAFLESLRAVTGTLVLYESPYRIQKLLEELRDIYPDRHVVLGRELTKKFEEFLRGTPEGLLAALQQRSVKGEFVVMIAGPDEGSSQTPQDDSSGSPGETQ